MMNRREAKDAGDSRSHETGGENPLARHSDGLSVPVGARSARVWLKLSKDGGPLVRTYEAVLPFRGFAVVASASEADVVVTDSVQTSQSMLAAGHTVIHLSSDRPLAAFERPREKLKNHPEYGPRYHCVNPLRLIDLYSELSKIEKRDEIEVLPSEASSRFDSILAKSSLRGLSILVVDNSELNRASAIFQLSERNSLAVCETYKEAVDLLKSKTFDVALLDLLMPPESFTLSGAAFEKVIGSEFPAGIFTALVAARAGVKNIRIITDASHHDHPATALIDYISWGTELPCGNASRITFEKAHTVQIPRSTGRVNDSVKDWTSTLEVRTLFGMERTAHQKSK